MTISEPQETILDLGCGRNKHPNAIGVDNVPLDNVDLVHDLLSFPYPFQTECANEVILSHVLEHFSFVEINAILTEVHRVLSPFGVVTVSVPHAFCVAFCTDPTHRTSFTFETMYYFTKGHCLSYYQNTNALWEIEKIWASVNLLNDKFVPVGRQQQRLNKVVSRALSHVVRRSRSKTLPDLVVKQFPFWLVSIHCKLVKSSSLDKGRQ